MKQLRLALGIATLATGMSGAVTAQQVAGTMQPVRAKGEEISLTGCLVKGEGGFVLSNPIEGLKGESATTRPGTGTRTTMTPAQAQARATATAPPLARLLYWLDVDNDTLEPHAGHRVEVTGEVEGDIDTGNIEIEREEGMIELEISYKGEKVTVKLPDTRAGNATAVGTTGTVPVDKPKDLPLRVRRLDVSSVKMLSATCS